ncbi:hypothetical protein Fmac_015769 [Flemingia macrophylla]|uniref:Alpha/beta hydrolase fold-3 domain-containing protein n=1 Tax=Flemingia macrophylla TaxID=520843 RepID=A0ABD1MFH4_9FABA
MANAAEVIVVSVEYRLTPEHRIPAAYGDAMEALRWIGRSQDEWLTQCVDYSMCYLMGSSAGPPSLTMQVTERRSYIQTCQKIMEAMYVLGHDKFVLTGLRAIEEVNDLEPLKIQGLILRQPFFGGTQRTESELRLENDPIVPLRASDMMWELALPIGADRDHEYCNLRAGNGVEKYEKMKELGWRVLVSGNGEDPLVDRDKELAQLMEEKGVEVVQDFQEDGIHGDGNMVDADEYDKSYFSNLPSITSLDISIDVAQDNDDLLNEMNEANPIAVTVTPNEQIEPCSYQLDDVVVASTSKVDDNVHSKKTMSANELNQGSLNQREAVLNQHLNDTKLPLKYLKKKIKIEKC